MPLGVHFAITEEQKQMLEGCDADDARIGYLQETIEDEWDEEFLVATDKAWDAIHRSLGEFPPDTPWFYRPEGVEGAYAHPEDHGDYPLKLAVLGGKRLTDDESRYFIRLIEPNEVKDVAAALEGIDRDTLHQRYFTHCKGAWPEYGEEDFEYTWEYFQAMRDFYRRIAGSGRAVIFTADQ